MTIEKGRDWGRVRRDPFTGPHVSADGEAAALLTAAGVGSAQAGSPGPVIGLDGGDLCRSLGGPRPAAGPEGAELSELPLDAVLVHLDGAGPLLFVAHLVARRRGWRGPFTVVMNAQWLGAWKLGPRAHPNDGLVDVTSGRLELRQRLVARRRAPHGGHVPHPTLHTERVAVYRERFEGPRRIWLDGVPTGRAREIEVSVVPDAWAAVL